MNETRAANFSEQLAMLQKLCADGVLSDDEFERIKRRLLEKQEIMTPAAQCEQATESMQRDDQQHQPPEVLPIGDPYRVVKALVQDTLIVFGFGFAGVAIVASIFHFRLRPTAAIAPLALATALSYTLGFSVIGIRASGEQYWRRLYIVAIFAWLAGIIDIVLLGLSLTGWALSSIWIALAVAMGGGIGLHLRRASKDFAPAKNKFDPRNWKQLPPRTMLIAASSAVAITILGTSYMAYDNEPKAEKTYSDLTLGMTMQQVKLVKGNSPSNVGVFPDEKAKTLAQGGTPVHDFLSQRTLLLLDATKLPDDKKIDDYPVWAYSSADQHTILRLNFDPHTKALTGVACVSTAYSDTTPFGLMDCQGLRGVQDRWSEDVLIKKLGNPTGEKSDGAIKILRYEDLGVQYFLTQGHVFMLSLFSTQ